MRFIKTFFVLILMISMLLIAACGVELGSKPVITDTGSNTTTIGSSESAETTVLDETTTWAGTTAPIDTVTSTSASSTDDIPEETTVSTEDTTSTTSTTTTTTTTKGTTSTTTAKATTAATATTKSTTTKATTTTKTTTTKALSIKTQPKSFRLPLNTAGKLTVEVTGGRAPYIYKWQSQSQGGWEEIKDSNTAWSNGTNTLNLYATSPSLFIYHEIIRCEITDSNGAKVASNSVGMEAPLSIIRQPTSPKISPGSSGSVFVSVLGGREPYTYQWESLSQGYWEEIVDGFDVSGSNTRTLTLKPDVSWSWIYHEEIRCKITDAEGNFDYSDTVTITG